MWKNKKQAALTLSFDDCYQETIKKTLPLLKKHSYPATYNFIAGLAGRKFEGLKIASWSDLKKLAHSNMEIASHSLTHADLAKRTRAWKFLHSFPYQDKKIKFLIKGLKTSLNLKFLRKLKEEFLPEEEIIKSKKLLFKKGFKVVSFVYPRGSYNQKIKNLVKNHYTSARTTDTGLNKSTTKNLYTLKAFIWDKDTTPNIANKWVNKAIEKKAWLIESFHLVSDKNKTNHQYFTTVGDFEKHLRYIKSQDIWIASQKEVVNYLKVKTK